AGHAALHDKLSASGVPAGETLVVMEATGSYWVTFATTLTQGGYAGSVINPRPGHDFAKAPLKRAQTDAIDPPNPAPTAAPVAARALDAAASHLYGTPAAAGPTR